MTDEGFPQIIEEGEQSFSIEWDCTENGLAPISLFETDFIDVEGMEFYAETTDISGTHLPPADEWKVGES